MDSEFRNEYAQGHRLSDRTGDGQTEGQSSEASYHRGERTTSARFVASRFFCIKSFGVTFAGGRSEKWAETRPRIAKLTAF